jgi:hypothetical protein
MRNHTFRTIRALTQGAVVCAALGSSAISAQQPGAAKQATPPPAAVPANATQPVVTAEPSAPFSYNP